MDFTNFTTEYAKAIEIVFGSVVFISVMRMLYNIYKNISASWGWLK